MILLKAQWLTSNEVASQVGCCEVVVNSWLARYQTHRIECRFKRIRRQVKHKPNADIYEFKRECLAEFEQLSEQGFIDLFNGDETCYKKYG